MKITEVEEKICRINELRKQVIKAKKCPQSFRNEDNKGNML